MNTYLREMLGRYILEKRQELNLSQYELAEKMGFSAQFLGRLEKGKSNIATPTLERFIQVLGMEEAKLRKIYGYAAVLFVDSLFGKETPKASRKSI